MLCNACVITHMLHISQILCIGAFVVSCVMFLVACDVLSVWTGVVRAGDTVRTAAVPRGPARAHTRHTGRGEQLP